MQVPIMFSNKKSDMSARKIIFYGIASFVSAIVFLVLVGIVTSNRSEISEIPIGLEDYLLVQRFLNSNLCFTFLDIDAKRAHHWFLDLARFNQESLDKCYDGDDTKVKAYRLTLTYLGEKKEIKTKNWEGFLNKGETINLFLYDKGKIGRAELFIETQNAK